MSMKKLPLHSFLAVSAMLMSLEGSGVAEAASLQVAPVLLEVPATGSTSTLTLRNEGARSLDAQIRVFKWTQDHGTEHLEPTDDVVASPPEATLASRTDYTVRVVRNSSTPVTGEEAYRLVVDELPDPLREKNGSVVVVVRHAVPLFFMPEEPETPRLRWSTDVRNGKICVTVTNDGGRRMRISNMTISNGAKSVSFGAGLIGYALAKSSMTWSRPAPAGFSTVHATVTADGDAGKINSPMSVRSAKQ